MQNMYEIALNDGQNEINTHTKWDIWYIFIVFLRAIIQEYSPETEDFFSRPRPLADDEKNKIRG